MNADGTNLTQLTDNSSANEGATWSPDGLKIAFASDRTGSTEIYAMNADGANQTQITNKGGQNLYPQWSPDGSKILFWSEDRYYFINSDGSNETQISTVPGDYGLTWSPDMTRFSFQRTVRDYPVPYGSFSEIHLININGGNESRITFSGYNGGGTNSLRKNNYGAVWQPPCQVTITPNGANFPANGANGLISVSTQSNCQWFAKSGADWIIINSPSFGASNGTVNFTVLPNPGAPRTGNILINNRLFTVRQGVTIIDNVAPSVNINNPVAANYALNQSLQANFNCFDSESGIASCVGTAANGALLDTASVGIKTFTVTAVDRAGNQSIQTVTYNVVYNVTPLFDQTKTHNAGSNIPIRLKIVDANAVNHSAANIQLTAIRVDPGNLAAQSPGNSNPQNVFSLDSTSQSYSYNLKSKKAWVAGTYRLVFRIAGDPTEHSVNLNIR